MGTNQNFIDIAEQLKPELNKTKVIPNKVMEVIGDKDAFQGWKINNVEEIESLKLKSFGRDEGFMLDFGDHQVGYLNLSIMPIGSPPDAPLRLKLIFGEMPCEMAESFDDYNGWMSRSWLQEEIINIDVLPCDIRLPRRYSFRYLKVSVIDTSRKYKVAFSNIYCTTVTSADISKIVPLPDNIQKDLKIMDKIAIKTLQDCMQSVFEDGPKRDRRLWIGDLRLQALANYYTFKNNDLVKRCLYLFGGLTIENGNVGACVFIEPKPLVDDTFLYDYSLFFVAALYDYYIITKDKDTLDKLWPVALKQIELAIERLDVDGIVKDDPSWWCFIDWHPELNKQAAAQAVLIYCMKRGLYLAEELQQIQAADFIKYKIEFVSKAALKHLWDVEEGFFRSGGDGQISWASQVWMVLAEVLGERDNENLLERLFMDPPAIKMNTPYMYHHFIDALFLCGMKEKALEQMRAYWGEMVKKGADCFWEVFNIDDEFFSTNGGIAVNSYCHAWSCTPTYFIRKYLM